MNLSKEIAGMILDMLSDSGTTEIRRNDLAEQLGCVPSQINYVISSRFTPEHGYSRKPSRRRRLYQDNQSHIRSQHSENAPHQFDRE